MALEQTLAALIPAAISEQDWAVIIQCSGIAQAQRDEIGLAVAFYRIASEALGKSQPHGTRLALRSLSKKIDHLRNELSGLRRNPLALVVLARASGSKNDFPHIMNRREPDRRLTAITAQLEPVSQWFTKAAAAVATRSPRRAHMINVNLFVAELARIYERSTGKSISRSLKRHNQSRDFIVTVCRMADPTIGPGAIDDAMKRLIKARGGKRARPND
jgi:hypothetical protein